MNNCRFCKQPLTQSFIDLGMSPLANSFVSPERLAEPEVYLPLRAFVCNECFLVQLEDFESPEEIFRDYAYFSSYSKSWLQHAQEFVEKMVREKFVDKNSHVIEVASNDGYLLQYFKEHEISVTGIEPAKNIASIALTKGIPTINEFLGKDTALKIVENSPKADLLIGNNVLAHVPDINDFVAALKILLNESGTITMEFPHLMELLEKNQFDTIYHEHFSYLSLTSVIKIFKKHELDIFMVEKIPTHGGSLRIYAKHLDDLSKSDKNGTVQKLLVEEENSGLKDIDTYSRYSQQVLKTKQKLVDLLLTLKEQNKSIVGYGAPAKGNTLLNYCEINRDVVEYTVDISPHKQGLYLPGTHIPIHSPDKILESKPDYILILPWNLKDEIMSQLSFVRQWGGKFILPIPEVRVI